MPFIGNRAVTGTKRVLIRLDQSHDLFNDRRAKLRVFALTISN